MNSFKKKTIKFTKHKHNCKPVNFEKELKVTTFHIKFIIFQIPKIYKITPGYSKKDNQYTTSCQICDKMIRNKYALTF